MSSGFVWPEVTADAPVRPLVEVSADLRPAVASVMTFGPVGQEGKSAYQLWLEAGNTGSLTDFLASLVSTVPGPVSRLGTIRWADTHVDPEDYFAANVRQQLKFVPDPAQTQDFLGPPFEGAVSWTDNRIVVRPNSKGDWQNITVNLLVVAGYAGGKITADLDVGTGAPVQTSTYVLSGAGVAERATFPLGVSTLDGVLANGIRVFLTGTVPFVIQSEAIVYKPDLPGTAP